MKTLNIVNVVTVPSLNKTAILYHEIEEGKEAVAANWIVDGLLTVADAVELAKTRVDATVVDGGVTVDAACAVATVE